MWGHRRPGIYRATMHGDSVHCMHLRSNVSLQQCNFCSSSHLPATSRKSPDCKPDGMSGTGKSNASCCCSGPLAVTRACALCIARSNGFAEGCVFTSGYHASCPFTSSAPNSRYLRSRQSASLMQHCSSRQCFHATCHNIRTISSCPGLH
jgi:hypothetical protein